MNRADLIRDMKQTTGSSFITVTELCKYLGKTNRERVKNAYLRDLDRIGKAYFIPDVATSLIERRKVQ